MRFHTNLKHCLEPRIIKVGGIEKKRCKECYKREYGLDLTCFRVSTVVINYFLQANAKMYRRISQNCLLPSKSVFEMENEITKQSYFSFLAVFQDFYRSFHSYERLKCNKTCAIELIRTVEHFFKGTT